MAGARDTQDGNRGLMQHVNAADINCAIGQLISLFVTIFDAVLTTNAQNAESSFSFDDYGALVNEDAMKEYTAVLAESSPHKEDFASHAAWVFRVVPASLKCALARLSGQPSSLVIATCEMYVFMALSIMELSDEMVDDAEDDDFMEDDEEEAAEEEGFLQDDAEDDGDGEDEDGDVASDTTEPWNIWMID